MPGRRHHRKKSSEEDTSSLEVPSGTQMMLGLLNPDEVEALGGVPREAIVGELMRAPLPEDPFDLPKFSTQPALRRVPSLRCSTLAAARP